MRSEVLLQQTTKWHLTLRFCGHLQCSRDPQPSCQKPTPLNPTNPATFPRNIIRTFLMLCTCLRTSGLLYGLESNAVAISNRSCLCRGFAEVGLWGELGRFLLPHFFSAVFPSSVPNINSPQWKLVFFFCLHTPDSSTLFVCLVSAPNSIPLHRRCSPCACSIIDWTGGPIYEYGKGEMDGKTFLHVNSCKLLRHLTIGLPLIAVVLVSFFFPMAGFCGQRYGLTIPNFNPPQI